MELQDLKPNPGAKKARKRVGRGVSSGDGKTAGRGMKGQGARAGGGTGLYHQGGNLPLFRRLPFKRGFTPPNRVYFNEVNLDQLADFKAGAEITPESLEEARLIRRPGEPIVLLGRGELKSALKVRLHRVSRGARQKVEAAGGTVEIIE